MSLVFEVNADTPEDLRREIVAMLDQAVATSDIGARLTKSAGKRKANEAMRAELIRIRGIVGNLAISPITNA